MKIPSLYDANTYPTDEVIASVLGNCYKVYQVFVGAFSKHQIELEWRYYNDVKSWLGKGILKGKTIFWLSIWQDFFKVSFHFTEKTRLGIMSLPIADEIKTRIKNEPIKGKLVSLIIDVSESTHLNDVFTLVSYKQSCM